MVGGGWYESRSHNPGPNSPPYRHIPVGGGVSLSVLGRINGGAQWGMGLGGLPELTNAEVMGALGGRNEQGQMIDERALWVAQVFYGLDGRRATQRLIDAVAELFRKRCDANGWRRNGLHNGALEAWYQSVGGLVCMQHFGGYRCPSCEGRGVRNYKDCPACNGTGGGEGKDSQKAALLHIGQDAYRKVWRARIQPLQGDVQSWEAEAARHIRHQIA